MRNRFSRSRALLPALMLLAGFFAGTAAAHDETDHAQDNVAIGITEHLGGKIPLDATFRDESGKTVRLADLVTGPTIMLPVYFNCTNVCYNLQWGMAQLLPKIKSTPEKDYRVISISFDENDSPAVATTFKRVYLGTMRTPFPEGGWRFLTGDAKTIRRVMDAAGFGFQRKGRDFIHPSGSFIITGDGTIVRYLYGTTFLAKDLTMALIEARDGVPGATIRKIVDYCFTFDPGQKTYAFNLLRVSATVVIVCTGGFLGFLIMSGKKRKNRTSMK